MPKDHFSKQSSLYAKFRPTYPQELYTWLLSLVEKKGKAWDCGTGNGQVAIELAKYFEKVIATDISQKQLDKATPAKNIVYEVSRSEKTIFKNDFFDLITVAQAIHWFDFEAFYQEVHRVLKPKGVLALWGYGLLRIEPAIDELLDHYYQHIIGPYWASERKHIDNHYQNIGFPFENTPPPQNFFIETTWTIDQMEGYLNTWSSLQTFLKTHTYNPVDELIAQMKKTGKWDGRLLVRFPIFTKVWKR